MTQTTVAAEARQDTAQPRQRARRRSALTPTQKNQLGVLVVIGCLLATFVSDASPTGHSYVDLVYRCGFVVATILGASRARRWSLVIASGLVVIGSTTFMLIPAVGALALAGTLAWLNQRDRIYGAVVGLLVGWAALNLVWPTTTGATALLAAVAIVPLWISGYRVARSKPRRVIRRGGYAMVVIALVGCAVAGVVIVTQRNVLNSAAEQTIEAARGMTGATTAESSRKFSVAADRFESSARIASAWWTYPARLVPVVSQNLDAVHQAAASGGEVNRIAGQIAGSVDYDKLQLDGGGIDLAVLASFEEPVERADAVISSVDEQINDLDSPWLVKPLRDRLDTFAKETGRVRVGAQVASLAVHNLPAMLGANGERRYLLLLGNPAESRDIGGHLGTFAELSATNGSLDVGRVLSPYELYGPQSELRPVLENTTMLPPALLEMNPTRFPQNWGASPDMDKVADVAATLFPQSSGGHLLDGVLYADPYAFAAVLKLVGPVQLSPEASGTGNEPVVVDSDNAVAFLTRDQFAIADKDVDPAKELVEVALDRLTSNRLPAISAMLDALGPVVEEGRLQFVSYHRNDNVLLERLGLDQPFQQPKGGDLLAVINRDAFPSKIDAYLERKIDYWVSWNPSSGAVESRVAITLENTATTEGLSELAALSPEGTKPGTNRTVLSVITPFEAINATLDGDELPFGARPEQDDLRRYSALVDIEPGARRTVEFNLRGDVAPGPDYPLSWYNQPLVNPDTSRLVITSLGRPFVGGAKSGTITIGRDRMVDLKIRTEP